MVQVIKYFHLPFKLSVYVLFVAMHVLIFVRQLLIGYNKLHKLSACFLCCVHGYSQYNITLFINMASNTGSECMLLCFMLFSVSNCQGMFRL